MFIVQYHSLLLCSDINQLNAEESFPQVHDQQVNNTHIIEMDGVKVVLVK